MILKPGNSKMIVGYDLGHTCSQISYYSADTSKVETAASVAGTNVYSIPTVLCKRYGTSQWLYGKEALRAAKEEEGILVDDLLLLAMDGEPVLIEEQPYDPVALLTLFLKKSLGLLTMAGTTERIGAFLISCEEMDTRLMEVLGQALAGLNLKARHICFQNYEESFYQYMIHQPRELWEFGTVMFWYDTDSIKVYRMQCNERTTPRAVFVEKKEYPFGQEGQMTDREERDEKFAALAKKICGNDRISAVYLIGQGFDREWMKDSLRFLCNGRRVFLGSNLFSQGACLGMMERLKPSQTAGSYVLLGTDKLKVNVGMRVSRKGEDSYCALLNAGTNWYEAQNDCDFYLQEENSFELVVTPLSGRKGKLARMTLEGLPDGISRLHLHLQMKDEETLSVKVEDLGFGEFRSASHKIWEEELRLGMEGR